jgi:FkbM family methyltransferase
MRNKTSTGAFLRAYNMARRAGVLDWAWFQRMFLFAYFRYKRWYEDPFWALTKSHPEWFVNGDILDIGANMGYTAWVFATATKLPAKVYAFEPDRISFTTLSEVIRRKHLGDRIEPLNLAIGSGEGTLEFWHNDEHSADHRVVTSAFRSGTLDRSRTTTVSVTSVDNFVAARGVQNISFIKVDVQGYELAVCEGMRQTLEKFPELRVAVEYEPESIRELGFQPAALLRFFRAAGYQLYILSRGGIDPAPEDGLIAQAAERSGYVDLLCTKNPITDAR